MTADSDVGVLAFRVLGSFECTFEGAHVPLRGPLQERLVVYLLLNHERVVPVSRLVEAVWDDGGPDTAAHQVRKMVSDLRKRVPSLGASLSTSGSGYRLALGSAKLDLVEFHEHLRRAQKSADGRSDESSAPGSALVHIGRALDLWRGPLLGGRGGLVIDAASTALEERRVSALEKCFELRLQFGQLDGLVGELRDGVAEYPLREQLRAQLMRALYVTGSRVEALEEFHSIRRLLDEAYGVDPGPGLNSLYQRILQDDVAYGAASPVLAGGVPGGAASVHPAVVASAPNTLPYMIPDFVGRTEELQELYAAAGAGDTVRPHVRAVVIYGMAGVGKSTLAIHAAHRLGGYYSGGQLYIDLQSYTAGATPIGAHHALFIALSALGYSESAIPGDPAARVAAWRSATSSAPLLVLIDNAAFGQDVSALVPNCPGSLVVVTSRDRISGFDGALSVRLGVLSLAESIELLERVIGRERVAAELAAAAQLAHLCGHLPLALRISAARLVSRENQSIAWLAERLADEAIRLDLLCASDRSVTASISSSDQAMPPELRRALRLLSLCPGGSFDTYAARALLGGSEIETESVLELLLDRHLIEPLPKGRFGIHDLVRAYAVQYQDIDGVLDAPQVDQALESLLSFYAVVSGTASDVAFPGRNHYRDLAPTYPGAVPIIADHAAAITWFDVEYCTAHALIRTASARGLDAHVAHISRNLAHYLHIRDHEELFLTSARLAHDACRALGSASLLSNALVNLAIALWKNGQVEEGVVLLSEALCLADKCEDRLGQAVCLSRLGAFHHTLGENELAAAHLHRAITLAVELGRPREEIAARISLCSTLVDLACFKEAVRQAKIAADLCIPERQTDQQIMALANLGKALLRSDRAAQAVSVLAKAHGLIRTQREMTPHTALVLANLAEAYKETGQTEIAVLYANQADVALADGKSAPVLRTDVLNTLGRVYRDLSEAMTAVERHAKALSLARDSRYAIGEAAALAGLAACCDDPASARTYRASADAIFDRHHAPAAVRSA